MALGNFFGKNALAAHQILGGMTPETFEGVLGAHVVGIVFDDAAAAAREGRAAASLAVNLAARLYPRLALASLGSAGGPADPLLAELTDLARSINPDIELVHVPGAATMAVVIGETSFPGAARTIYAGSRGWNAMISPERPRGSGDTPNPFGAGAAACFAVANVFRSVFQAHLPEPDPDSEFALSLYDYRRDEAGEGGPGIGTDTVNLGETILAGVGAIGNAAVWALARVPGVRGLLHLVDPQVVGLSNLQRYVLARQEHLAPAVPKVELAAEVLRAAQRARGEDGLAVAPHPQRWGEFLRARGDWRMERVLTAFDTKGDRIAAQASLPRRLLNAWTQLGDLGLSRHLAFGRAPCLACLYSLEPGGKSEAELVGDAMGLPGAPGNIREMLYSGAPIGEAFVREVAARRGVTSPEAVDVLLAFAGRSLREFYDEAFCGGVILQLGGSADGEAVRAEAPMAFQSALAGIMLAAETVVDAGRQPDAPVPPVRTVIDLSRPLPPYLSPPAARRTDGACLCNDADYLDAYRAKYAAPAVQGAES
ncbi:MAG: E2 ligase fold family C protein [Longimicrobiaceae bacterium]